jgi:hypothetical protein
MPDRERIEKIQKIVPWQEEERIGLRECYPFLPTTSMGNIDLSSHNLPDGIDVFVVGGLAEKSATRHDVDVFITNNTETSKDHVDSMVKKAFLGSQGRTSRVYNLDKFEQDMLALKGLIEQYNVAKTDSERENICTKLNPILEIHSHCKLTEKAGGWDVECVAKTPEEIRKTHKVVWKCNNKGCFRV